MLNDLIKDQLGIIEKIAVSMVNTQRTRRKTELLKTTHDLRPEDSDMFLDMAQAAFDAIESDLKNHEKPQAKSFIENAPIIDLEINNGAKINGGVFLTKQFEIYPELKQQIHAFLKTSVESKILLVSLPGAHPAAIQQSPADYELPYRIPGVRLALELKQFNHLVFSDPGHFLGGLAASFFIGGANFNMFDNIVKFVDLVVEHYGFSSDKVIFMGGSAGGFAAFQASTYSTKYNKAFILNQQVSILDYVPLNKYGYFTKYFNMETDKQAFASRFCCIERAEEVDFAQKSYYFLCNVNDPHYAKNFALCEKIKNECCNFVFDTYNGSKLHAAPEYEFFREKVVSVANIFNNEYNHSTNNLIIRGE